MSLKVKATEGIRYYGLATVLANLAKLGQLVVLANLLAPADIGVFGMVTVVIGLATMVADSGTANALIHRDHVTSTDLSSLLVLNVISGALLALTLWLCAPWIAWIFSEPRVEWLLRVYVFILPITMLGVIFHALLEKNLEFALLAKLDVWSVLAGVLVAITSAMAGAGVYAFVWGAITNALVRTLTVVHLGTARWALARQLSFFSLRSYFQFGLPNVGQRLVNYVYGNVDIVLIGAFLGAQALGYYSLAQQLILMLTGKINIIFARVFFPVFSPVKHDIERLRNGYFRLLEYTALINLPLLAGIAVVAPLFVPLVIGSAWVPAIVLIQILAVVSVARTIISTSGPLLLVKGRTLLGLRWSLSVVVLQTVVMVGGVASGSLVTAAIANAVLSCALLPVSYFTVVRPLLGECLAGYLKIILPSFWMAIVMGVAVLSIGNFTGHENLTRGAYAWLVFAIEVCAGGLVYIALMWFRDRKQLLELLAMASGRMKG